MRALAQTEINYVSGNGLAECALVFVGGAIGAFAGLSYGASTLASTCLMLNYTLDGCHQVFNSTTTQPVFQMLLNSSASLGAGIGIAAIVGITWAIRS